MKLIHFRKFLLGLLGYNFQLIHYDHFSSGLDSMSALHVHFRQAIEKQSCKLQKVSFNTSKVRIFLAPNDFYSFKYHWLPLLRQTESAQGNHKHLSNVDLVVYHRQGPDLFEYCKDESLTENSLDTWVYSRTTVWSNECPHGKNAQQTGLDKHLSVSLLKCLRTIFS